MVWLVTPLAVGGYWKLKSYISNKGKELVEEEFNKIITFTFFNVFINVISILHTFFSFIENYQKIFDFILIYKFNILEFLRIEAQKKIEKKGFF